MERIRQMNLKKALFTIAFLHCTAALVLSLVSFLVCIKLSAAIAPQWVVVNGGYDPPPVTELPHPTAAALRISELLSVLQIALPILFYTAALLLTASMFYSVKLKEPLETLAKGAMRISENDLNFTLETKSGDELGQLCGAFETMRAALLDNNQKLWCQTEERKRLNAAFSHNLRNPVTVLKGSAKLAQKGLSAQAIDAGQIMKHISRIECYAGRIERYVETMSRIQSLEEMPVDPKSVPWESLITSIKDILDFAGADSRKQIHFTADHGPGAVRIDLSYLSQIAENLISNALRFAAQSIEVMCSADKGTFTLSVIDDGCGFPGTFIKSGIGPFRKGTEDSEHFGMGLYACAILCRKHGGNLTIQNQKTGAAVLATLKIHPL